MRVSLINLGDGARCLFDARSRAVTIGVGEIVDADLTDATIARIRKFHSTDTLLVGPEGSIKPPVHLRSVMDILKNVDVEPYDELLSKFWKVVPRVDGATRPTRMFIRKSCQGLVQAHINQVVTSDDFPADDEADDDEEDAAEVHQMTPSPRNEQSARLSGRRRARR